LAIDDRVEIASGCGFIDISKILYHIGAFVLVVAMFA
jgi:hypothetical protein